MPDPFLAARGEEVSLYALQFPEGGGNASIVEANWSSPGLTITPPGASWQWVKHTAPLAAGPYVVTATKKADSSLTAQLTVTVPWTLKLLGAESSFVRTDAAGNVYVAGTTKNQLGAVSTNGATRGYLAKYDAAGMLQWKELIGSTDTLNVFSMAVDPGGNVYLAGAFSGTLDGQDGGAGGSAMALKFDTHGGRQWVKTLKDGSDPTGGKLMAVALDATGNLRVAGRDVANSLMVAKLDANGNQAWLKRPGPKITSDTLGLAVDASGNAHAAAVVTSNYSTYNAQIATYEPDGDAAGTLSFNVPATSDTITALAMDGNALYVGGITSGSMDGAASGAQKDGYVRKLDLDGQVLWTHQFHTASKDEVRALALATDGSVYVVGSTSGSLASHAGSDDQFFAKLPGGGGSPIFLRQLGTANQDLGSSVHVAGDRIFVTGMMYGPYEGYPGGATKHLIQLFNPTGVRQ
jgi:hypothetical protein